MKQSKRRFEVVLLSCERDQQAFQQQRRSFPFLTVAFDDPKRNQALATFEINAIPRLILLDPFGTIIVDNALGSYDANDQSLSVENVDKWLQQAKRKLYS